jgi:hypothetical protein
LTTRNIAPDIFRQRLLIEGYYTIDVTREVVNDYLLEVAKHLDLRTYGAPTVFSPASGMGRQENAGFDGFVPSIPASRFTSGAAPGFFQRYFIPARVLTKVRP